MYMLSAHCLRSDKLSWERSKVHAGIPVESIHSKLVINGGRCGGMFETESLVST